MLFNCSFLNKNFEIVEEGNLETDKNCGRILECNEGYASSAKNFKNFIVIPALINAHTHIGDSFAKDIVKNLNVKECCGNDGIKWKLYKRAKNEEILEGMKDSALQMLDSGISTFTDFREFGMNGVRQLKYALNNIPIKPKILAREIRFDDMDYVAGLGLNLYNIDSQGSILEIIKEAKKKGKIFAIHAGETRGEIERALNLEILPDVIVHFLNPSDEEIEKVKKKNISIVLCPRSNALLKCGLPNLGQLIEAKINVCLGTDNVMLNSPDLWQEMEFVYKISSLQNFVEPKEILKAVTINAANALNLNSGIIDRGKDANLVFINKNTQNLRHSKDIMTSLINRCKGCDVSSIMIDGRFV